MVEQNDLYFHELNGEYSGPYKGEIDAANL